MYCIAVMYCCTVLLCYIAVLYCCNVLLYCIAALGAKCCEVLANMTTKLGETLCNKHTNLNFTLKNLKQTVYVSACTYMYVDFTFKYLHADTFYVVGIYL